MDVACGLCGAFKFAREPPRLCCLNDKVNLPLLTPPPEPLHSMLRGETQESRHFIESIRKYSGCFQITLFGLHIIKKHGFHTTFKVFLLKRVNYHFI